MSLVQLYVPSEVAHDTIYELAEMGNFQFKDVSARSDTISEADHARRGDGMPHRVRGMSYEPDRRTGRKRAGSEAPMESAPVASRWQFIRCLCRIPIRVFDPLGRST